LNNTSHIIDYTKETRKHVSDSDLLTDDRTLSKLTLLK